MSMRLEAAVRVSTIIPAYKVAHLSEAVTSVLAQTFKSNELIVVNDGSPFDIRKTLHPFIESGRIFYIEQENGGAAAARNRGLREARGEFVAFLDDDDLWPPDKLEWQVHYLDEHPGVGMLGGGHHYIDHTGSTTGKPLIVEGEPSFEEILAECPFQSIGGTLIRTRTLQNAGGFDEEIWGADDYDLWLRLARDGCRIMRVPKVALYYRRHATNSSANVVRMYKNCERVIRRHLPFVSAPHRRRINLLAYRWLYEFFGERLLMGCKAKLLKGDFSDLLSVAAILPRLFRVALYDRRLFRLLCRDLLVPVRFHPLDPPDEPRKLSASQ
jgi:glycosyltransferase involved in cell wall biosynthesis